MTAARDTYRSRVYDAERSTFPWKQSIPTGDLQAYVDAILDRQAVRSRWGRRRIEVDPGRGGGQAYGSGYFRLGVGARNPAVVCHEMAHCLTYGHGYAPHGAEFLGVFLFLVETVMGKDDASALRTALRDKRAPRPSRAAIPEPTLKVPSRAEMAARKRAHERSPIEPVQGREVARLLRRAVAAGQMGATGTASRKAALAAAKAAEKIGEAA